MDEILAKASNQAVTFAIRSGISLASGLAIKTVTRLLDKIPEADQAKLQRANARLHAKVAILATSIDLIKLAAARGNSALDATVALVSDLQDQIDAFDTELNDILHRLSSQNQKDSVRAAELKIQALLDAISDAVPLISLLLTTSGVNLASSMSLRISPSILLRASSYLVSSNELFAGLPAAVGPAFDLKLYSVFYNPSRLKYVDERPDSVSAVSWKEEFARCTCVLRRLPGPGFAYELEAKESFDDNRYHDEDELPGVRKIKLHDITRQFFSASGKLLRLEGSNSPVLTLKIQRKEELQYLSFGEVGTQFEDLDSESDASSGYADAEEYKTETHKHLALLEYLIRLASLQEAEQQSLLDIKDEKLLMYLHDHTDGSVIPKSNAEKQQAAVEIQKQGQMLQEDSNINRLEKLSLGDTKNDGK